MSAAVRVRRARPADAAAVLALEALFPSDRLSPRSVKRFLAPAPAPVWVGTIDGRVQAALILLVRRNSPVARIYSLAVHPDARGRGLAKRLVRSAETAARRSGRSAISLEVRRDNRAARTLYAGLGYAELKNLPDYYDDGAPGLRLSRVLHSPVDKRAASKQNTVKQPFSRP